MGDGRVMNPRFEQIQSLVFSGFGRHPFASLLALRFQGPDVASALDQLYRLTAFGREAKQNDQVIQVGMTPRGLRALGVTTDVFPFSFRTPLGSEYHTRLLGDNGNSAPTNWHWNGDDCDLVVFCYARDQGAWHDVEARITANFERCHRVTMTTLDEGKEHFGFRDGITNPRITGDTKRDELPLGEFVLGYPDGANEIPTVSLSDGTNFGKDGTYLVVRQLSQNVPLFWNTLRSYSGDPMEWGAKLIGRWPDGRSLAQDPTFKNDLAGLECPLGAHIRRANPRDSFVSLGRKPIDLSRHRLLRRGRPYGLPCPSSVYPAGLAVTAKDGVSNPEDERGLVFACLGADISRQFEHVQQSWLNNTKHNGLRNEVCPITSAVQTIGDERTFTIPGLPVRKRLHQWPEVVTVKGSAYCFMPGKQTFESLIEKARSRSEDQMKTT
jgi:Dyp-type peroxidase family